MFHIAFDLDSVQLQKLYRNSSFPNAWNDIRRFLAKRQFQRIGQSLYESPSNYSLEDLVLTFYVLGEKQPWLSKSIKNLSVRSIGDEHDLLAALRSGASQVDWDDVLPSLSEFSPDDALGVSSSLDLEGDASTQSGEKRQRKSDLAVLPENQLSSL